MTEAAAGQLVPDPIGQVRAVLSETAMAKGVTVPSEAALARALDEFPGRDFEQVARDVDFWLRFGNGAKRRKIVLAQTYRNFLRSTKPSSAGEGEGKYGGLVCN